VSAGCNVLKYWTENDKENTMEIMPNSGVIIRYSEAFKLKVVEEIEKGHLTITEAMRLYDIKGGATIYNWVRKYGKNHLLKKIVRVEMKDEKNKIAELKRQIHDLESAVASLTLHNICLQSYIEVVEEGEQLDAKKKELIRSKLSPSHQIMLEKLMPNTRKSR
jgi:transposase-like protein